ncbi:LysR family transcriptional regulator [Neorhizobium alkalisoli]|uniref:HTH-type transcriptional regulator TtuA n=1 Tax=Neorhizobium alkalisoli TaxID=528178 RepID=A0A561QGD4_9HYPH|nr:LysR family transcriptional regulator [Neorhizobium alkalisoli]TWF49435.1 DNA-binding transcriptional LysR family regulator [Neorhizobium alkalisoli]
MIELRHLRYAVTVADEGHVTRAAERLGIQQPPLSQQIARLETMIGAPLFNRLPRGVELTDAGRIFVERARVILADVDLAVESARRHALGEQGRLAIGYTSSSALHPMVTSTIRLLGEKSPDVTLTLDETSSPDLIEGLHAGLLDVAFVRSKTLEQRGLVVSRILDEEMLVALPERHPLVTASGAPSAPIALSKLASEAFILYRRRSGPGLYDGIIAACLAAGFSPHIRHEAPRLLSTLGLVAAGLGISIIPASMAQLGTKGIAYLRLGTDTDLVAPLHLVHRYGRPSGPLKLFLEIVGRERLKQNTSGQSGP